MIQVVLLQGQSGYHSSGGTLTGIGGTAYASIGQVITMVETGKDVQMLVGVQRAIAEITSGSDTTVCSSDTLRGFAASASGGKWIVRTSIGTQIGDVGTLSVGSHVDSITRIDTVYYLFNGYTTEEVQIEVRARPELNCEGLTLVADGKGEVHLKDTLMNSGISKQGGFPSNLSMSDTVLRCTEGYDQMITLETTDSSGCATGCEMTITIQDTTRPETACTSASDLILTWEGLKLYPSGLSGASTDNCSETNLEFSFSSDFKEPYMTFSCREQLMQRDSLTLYMRDSKGNQSSCTVEMNFNVPSGEDCACDWGQLKLKGEISPKDYKAKEEIIALGSITQGGDIYMKAGERIRLLPGFKVDQGSQLYARIDSCGQVPGGGQWSGGGQVREASDMAGNSLPAEESGEVVTILGVYPNPFKDWFGIDFRLSNPGLVSVSLHDISGIRSYDLIKAVNFEVGDHELRIDGGRLGTGVYVLSVSSEGGYESRRLVKVD